MSNQKNIAKKFVQKQSNQSIKRIISHKESGFYDESYASIKEIVKLNKLGFYTTNSQEGKQQIGNLPVYRDLYAIIFKDLSENKNIFFAEKLFEYQNSKSKNNKRQLNIFLDEANEYVRFEIWKETIQLYKQKCIDLKKKKPHVIKNQVFYDERAFIVGFLETKIAIQLCESLNYFQNIVAWYSPQNNNSNNEQCSNFLIEIPVILEPALHNGIYSKIKSVPLISRFQLNNQTDTIFEDQISDNHPFYQYYSKVSIIDTRWGYQTSKHKDGLFKITAKILSEIYL